MFGKLLSGIAALSLFLSLGLSNLHAQTVVVPNANEFVEGNSNNGFPFSAGTPIRYQQVYESTQFPECGNIVQINFRYDESSSGGSETYPDILIRLSITNVTPATLSTTFADNIGTGEATVYEGELSFSAPDCDTDPCPFDNTITLQTPYRYNPNNGNLLLDVTNPAISIYEQFDSVDVEGTTVVQRVWNAGDAAADSGIIDGDDGLVTQFVCVPVVSNIPTLSEWGLIAMAGLMGIIGFIVMRRGKVAA